MSKRLLVTYGYHVGEHFAGRVGLEYAKLDVPNVVVARMHGIRGVERMLQMRRDIGAKYMVDLHDDSTAPQSLARKLEPEKLRRVLEEEPKVAPHERYMILGQMEYEDAMKLLQPFSDYWNERRRREGMHYKSLRVPSFLVQASQELRNS